MYISDDEVGWLWVLLLLLIFVGAPWAVWHFDLNRLSDKITVYRQISKCDNNNKNCEWRNNKATTFKVNSSLQTVIYWSTKEPWPLKRAEDCIVESKKQWSCGNYSKYGFNEGDYTGEDTDLYRYVTKTNWWLKKWTRPKNVDG
jgi:hypothetical protein